MANMDRIAARLNTGEPIEIVSGPDDICVPLLGTVDDHCSGAGALARDSKAAMDLSPENKDWRPSLDRGHVAELRGRFRNGAIRSACAACPWESLCTDIARLDFTGAKLLPEADGARASG